MTISKTSTSRKQLLSAGLRKLVCSAKCHTIKMKRNIFLLLTLLLVISVAVGCSQDDNQNGEPTAKTVEITSEANENEEEKTEVEKVVAVSEMFGIPGKSLVKITDRAASQIAKLMASGDKKGLRIGVKKGGCAGMEYTMDYVDEIEPHDEVVESGDARVMIAPMAQMFLFGTEIDYEVSLLESGFKFKNPNVVDACGCGESIKFDESLVAKP